LSRFISRRGSRSRWFVLGPLFVLSLVTAPALAAGGGKLTPEEQQARALFDQGLALSDEARWSEALDIFKKSDELQHSANVRYNMAVSYRALGRYVEAKRLVDELLVKGVDDKPLKPALEKEVQKLRDEVVAKIVVTTIRRSPADGSLEIDGTLHLVGADGRVELDPGKHLFVLRKEGYETTTVFRNLEGSEVDIVLTAQKMKIAAPPPEVPFYKRGWFWGTVGAVAAAGAAVAVVVVVTGSERPASTTNPPSSTVDRIIPAGFTVRF
jgi:Tetratricopeptide repeat